VKAFTNQQTKDWMKTMPKRLSSAAMVLENSVGQVLIVKANYKPYWTFPGGIIDPHETPKQAAIRETREEVGIQIDPEKVEFVAVIDRRSDQAETYQFVFKTPLTPDMIDMITLETAEIDESVLVTRAQVISDDRHYGKVIKNWVNDVSGYVEQTFVIRSDE
jgi:8-oxo-dGTP diphosphatase